MWNSLYSSYIIKEQLLEMVKDAYRLVGYDYEQDFPGEYYFMHNTKTGEKVRISYRGSVREYR